MAQLEKEMALLKGEQFMRVEVCPIVFPQKFPLLNGLNKR